MASAPMIPVTARSMAARPSPNVSDCCQPRDGICRSTFRAYPSGNIKVNDDRSTADAVHNNPVGTDTKRYCDLIGKFNDKSRHVENILYCAVEEKLLPVHVAARARAATINRFFSVVQHTISACAT
jgi:hypothetical protein